MPVEGICPCCGQPLTIWLDPANENASNDGVVVGFKEGKTIFVRKKEKK